MATKNPNIDIDLNGLENLLDGVVAYVEVRSDFEDISNEIAREMRQMGAKISDKRDKNVTHVIFRNGTFRTSNWAKKHNIPLVSVGWLAACARKKLKFLCAPWREQYMIEPVDDLGLKKRIRYKKYCKAMNLEEFEADMNRSADRLKKRMNKSMDKSKANCSFGSNDNGIAEYERIMKLSDPMLRPRPPTPEYVKKHQRRIERIKQGGRYSWESSDEEKSDSTEDSDKEKAHDIPTMVLDRPLTESVAANHDYDDICTERDNEKTKKNGARRLFQNDSTVIQTLIEPTSKTKKTRILKKILPKVVLREIDKSNPKEKKRKRPYNDIDSPPAKRSRKGGFLDLSITYPIKESTQAQHVTLDHIGMLLKTPISLKIPTVNKTSLSPLVTNKATACSTPQDAFITPIKKRKSLRTRLLKNSARKLYREGKISSNDNSFNSDSSVIGSPSKIILVPETVFVDKKHNALRRMPAQSPSDPHIVPETPLRTIADISVTSNSSSDNPHCNSITSTHLRSMFDTPNASRILNEIFPNREQCESKNHILFVPKESYNHYSRAITPNFNDKIKHVAGMFPLQSLDKNEPQKAVARANVRRSVRLSNCNLYENDDFNPDKGSEIFLDKDTLHAGGGDPHQHSIPQISPAKESIVLDDNRTTLHVKADIKVTWNIRRSKVLPEARTHKVTDTEPSLCTNDTKPDPIEPYRKTRRSNALQNLHEKADLIPLQANLIPTEPKRITCHSNVPHNAKENDILFSGNDLKLFPHKVADKEAESPPVNSAPIEQQRKTRKTVVRHDVNIELHTRPLHADLNTLEQRRASRRSITFKAQPLIQPTLHTHTVITKSKPNLKRQWTAIGQEPEVKIKAKIKPNKRTIVPKTFRDSTDDFVFNTDPVASRTTMSRSLLSPVTNEVVFVGIDSQEVADIRASWTKMPQRYKCADILRTKEQLVVVPENPRRSMELIKAFIFGNTFVSLSWVLESMRQHKWLNYSAYTVPYTRLIEAPTNQSQQTSHLFKGYAAMYISTKAHALPKYKLRFVIEQSGGTVTDSFRQAGIVIDTRKVNALSVSSAWILDCVKEGRIVDHQSYNIV